MSEESSSQQTSKAKTRRRILVALPALLLVAWWIATWIPDWFAPKPRWTISANGENIQTCRNAPQLQVFPVTPLEDNGSTPITETQARAVAERVRGYSSGGPYTEVVEATFPDGNQHTAWYQIFLLDDGGYTLMGKAEVLFIDAQTGEPLLLIQDVTVGDPFMTCDAGNFIVDRLVIFWSRLLIPILLFSYIVIAGIVVLIGWLQRWRKSIV